MNPDLLTYFRLQGKRNQTYRYNVADVQTSLTQLAPQFIVITRCNTNCWAHHISSFVWYCSCYIVVVKTLHCNATMVLVTFHSLLNLKTTYKALIMSVSMSTYLHLAEVDQAICSDYNLLTFTKKEYFVTFSDIFVSFKWSQGELNILGKE